MAENTLGQWKLCLRCNRPALQEFQFCSQCGSQSWGPAPANVAPETALGMEEPSFGTRIPWTPLDVVKGIGFFLTFTLSAIALFVLVLLLVDEEDVGIFALAATAAVEGLLLVAIWLFAISKYRISWRALGFWRGLGAQDIRIAGVVVIGNIVLQLSYLRILEAVGIDTAAATPSTFIEEGGAVVVFLALLALLIAPVCEELFFRGFVFGGLTSRFGFWKAAVISALLFGLAHIEPIKIFPLFILGLLLAWAYYRTRSLWSAALAHFLNNGIALAVLLL